MGRALREGNDFIIKKDTRVLGKQGGIGGSLTDGLSHRTADKFGLNFLF